MKIDEGTSVVARMRSWLKGGDTTASRSVGVSVPISDGYILGVGVAAIYIYIYSDIGECSHHTIRRDVDLFAYYIDIF